MADRSLKLKDLRRILRSFGIGEDTSMGKGSHTTFIQTRPEGTFTYPVPTTSKDVKICYIKGRRKKFKLRSEDGIPDDQFYSR